MSTRLQAIGRVYQDVATLGLNTLVVFVLLNAVIYLSDMATASFRPRPNVVEARYGSAALTRVYPGMSEDEVRRLLHETWSRRREFHPYLQFRESPVQGRFVNVHEAGFRASKNQGPWPPSPESYTIFVFGGSTTFGYGLPDDQTVPSQLQNALRTRGHGRVAVYNFGAGAYQSTQERISFAELIAMGHRPDMAIFLDGLNEFAFPHIPQDTELVQRQLGEGHWRWMLTRLIDGLPVTRLAGTLASGALARSRAVEPVGADEAATTLIETVSNRYLANSRQIEAIGLAFGIQTVFVWQPIPYYKYDTTYHPFFDPGGVNRHARAGYEHLRRIIESDRPEPAPLWAADVQEDLREPLYVDSVHYTAAMSARLAEWIADHLATPPRF